MMCTSSGRLLREKRSRGWKSYYHYPSTSLQPQWVSHITVPRISDRPGCWTFTGGSASRVFFTCTHTCRNKIRSDRERDFVDCACLWSFRHLSVQSQGSQHWNWPQTAWAYHKTTGKCPKAPTEDATPSSAIQPYRQVPSSCRHT